jgi:hypothetical protein
LVKSTIVTVQLLVVKLTKADPPRREGYCAVLTP